MKKYKRLPNASSVPDGAVVLWSNPAEQTDLRYGLATAAAALLAAGVIIGVAAQRRSSAKTSNPSTSTRRQSNPADPKKLRSKLLR